MSTEEAMEEPIRDQNVPVDAMRPIKVICIGAGMSGIICGARFPQRIPNLDLTIYEKNDDVGGVWYENRFVSLFTEWNEANTRQISRRGMRYEFQSPVVTMSD
jgi:cation diffusion facilitator CzcD-associated flavoprotein CzcO